MDSKDFANAPKRDTEFPAAVLFDKEQKKHPAKGSGRAVWGYYKGVEKVPTPTKENPDRTTDAHVLAFEGADSGVIFVKGKDKTPITPKAGDLVSLMGQRLGRALRPEDIGLGVKIIYDGLEPEPAPGRSAAKLYTVQVLSPAA